MKNVLYLFLILTSTIHSNSQSVDQFVSRYLFMEKKDWEGKLPRTGNTQNFERELAKYSQDEVYKAILPYLKSSDEKALEISAEFIVACSNVFDDSLKMEVIERVTEVIIKRFDIYRGEISPSNLTLVPSYLKRFEPTLFNSQACENLFTALHSKKFGSIYSLCKLLGTLKLDGTKEELIKEKSNACRSSVSIYKDDCYSLNFSLAMMGDQEGVDYIISYIDRINGWDSRINYKDLGLIKNRKLFQRIIDNIVAGTVKNGHRVEKSVADPIREIKDNIIDFPQIGKYGALFDADIVKAVEWLTVHQYDFEIKP